MKEIYIKNGKLHNLKNINIKVESCANKLYNEKKITILNDKRNNLRLKIKV